MKNIGRTDRRWRIKLSIFMLAQAWFAPGFIGLAFALLAVFLALTAGARFCPLWWLGGVDTREVNSIEVLRGFVKRPK